MSGLKLWMRLHFKRFPKCKEHHYKYGIDKTLTTFQRDMGGAAHLIYAGRMGQSSMSAPKSRGHNKAINRENLLVSSLTKQYQREAIDNEDYREQIRKDEIYNKKYDVKMEKDVVPVCKRIKNKKKKKKKKRKKNKA